MQNKITKFLPDKYKSLSAYCFESVASTNLVAKELAANGTRLPFLVTADSQSAGRGRLGRSFYSPAATGIYMSLTIGTFPTPADAVFITTAAAVAVSDAIIDLTGKPVGIKWVNDIYLDDRKISGILAESQKVSEGYAVIVGIGLNMTTTYFPEDISDIAGALKTDVSKEQMIAKITENLLNLCSDISDKSFIERYKSRSVVLGKEIVYSCGEEKKTGIATDIDKFGGLVVQTETGDLITLSSGEISVRLK